MHDYPFALSLLAEYIYYKIMYINIVSDIFCKVIDLSVWDIFIHRKSFLFRQYFTNIRLMCTTSPQYKYTYDQIKISCISKIKITCYDSCCLLSNFLSRTLAFLLLLMLLLIDFLPADLVSKHYNTYHSKHSVKRLVQ